MTRGRKYYKWMLVTHWTLAPPSFRHHTLALIRRWLHEFIYLLPTMMARRYVFSPAFVCLSVCQCLCARLLNNACMDLDEMLCVDRWRDMDELRMPEPDCFLPQRMHCNVEFYYVGKIPHTGIEHPSKQRCMVLRRRNTAVGGKCALPSALLVVHSSIRSTLLS